MENGIIKIFDAQTGICIDELKGHRAHVTALAFNKKSNKLISGSLDCQARVWDILNEETVDYLDKYILPAQAALLVHTDQCIKDKKLIELTSPVNTISQGLPDDTQALFLRINQKIREARAAKRKECISSVMMTSGIIASLAVVVILMKVAKDQNKGKESEPFDFDFDI